MQANVSQLNFAALPDLQSASSSVFVEFGAGKGYLSCMLCHCSEASNLVLVDNQAFRNKAER